MGSTNVKPSAAAAPEYTPPGPGVWQPDLDHQDEPRGRLFFELFSESFRGGFANLFERYGLPLEELRSAQVNGWHYTSAKAVGAPEGAGAPPPNIVLKLLSRLHPGLRRRNRTAASAVRERLWLDDASGWEQERAHWVERCQELDAVVVETLDDDELLELVSDAFLNAQAMMRRHFELLGPALAAGRLLVAGTEWHLDPVRVQDLFSGASPASAATTTALLAIRERVETTDFDLDDVDDLDQLMRIAPDETAAFLAHYGRRPLDDDVSGATLAGHPALVVGLVRSTQSPFDAACEFEQARDELRGKVPIGERARFDELVTDVRQSFPSLEDNSGVTAQAVGSFHRILEAAEERAISQGLLNEVGDAELLGRAEIMRLFGPNPVPTQEIVNRRAALAAASAPPPRVLGGEVHPPPDPSLFPNGLAVVTAALGAYLANKFSATEDATSLPDRTGQLQIDGATVASGYGLGDEVTARLIVASTAHEALERIEPGAILVCPYTTPAWNVIFPMLAGIVTETGGLLGHTGVMAREFGLPALLGIGPCDPEWDGLSATLVPS